MIPMGLELLQWVTQVQAGIISWTAKPSSHNVWDSYTTVSSSGEVVKSYDTTFVVDQDEHCYDDGSKRRYG